VIARKWKPANGDEILQMTMARHANAMRSQFQSTEASGHGQFRQRRTRCRSSDIPPARWPATSLSCGGSRPRRSSTKPCGSRCVSMPEMLERSLRGEEARRKYIVRRVFDSSVERLFAAYSDPDELARWFAPPAATYIHFDVDCRAGGAFTYGLAQEQRPSVWGRIDYLDVRSPSKMTFVQSVTDKGGFVISPLANSDWPLRVWTDVGFRPDPGSTLASITVAPYDAGTEERAFFRLMWPRLKIEYEDAFDRLAVSLRSRGPH
jgi:uncharacterized protein YndB with AHSA1/START domain